MTTTDDKPAPGIRVHIAIGAELDRLAETLGVRPREGASESSHSETDVELRGRILARLGAMPAPGPSPQPGFVDPFGIPCPTHKVPAGQVCGFLDGDGAACCWRISAAAPPAPPPDDLTIAAINRSLRVMAEHGGGTPVMVSSAEEGAMDPAKPVAEPPYPFICASVDDVAEAFRRSTGVPVAFVTDVPALRVALGSVTEMADLLRRAAELVNWLSPFAFAYAAEHPESNMPTKIDADDVCRGATDLLARIDAAKAGT